MNTKILGIIAVIILLLAAGGIFLSQNKSATNTSTSITPTKTENKTSSLLDLLNLGKDQRCTFKTIADKTTSEGTLYIAGGKIRGDFKTTVDGKEELTSMIRVGDTNYIWGSTLPTGIKMTISLDKISSNEKANQYFNPTQKSNYNCAPWNVDLSVFTPPANIKFTDMTNLLMPKETGTQTKTNTTNPCSQITDATAKTACENALKQSGQ